MLLLIGILLGIGFVLLYQWMRPSTNDPYFFLTPKPGVIGERYYTIEKPIKLYQKGEIVDFVFWNVPQPTPKLLYLLPANALSPQVMLKIQKKDGTDPTLYSPRLFEQESPISEIGKSAFLNVKINKINEDLTESLIYEKAITTLDDVYGTQQGILFNIKDLGYDYGQYRIIVSVLKNIAALNNEDLIYSIYVRQHAIK